MSVPNGEKIVADYLRTHSAVSAITNRIVSKTPGDMSQPWVRYTLIHADSIHPDVHHLIDFALQLDCYAGYTGGKPQAQALMEAVRSALQAMPGVRGGATITAARVGWMSMPDPDLKGDDDNPRERYVMDASVYMHA